jgi:hypothetical protein
MKYTAQPHRAVGIAASKFIHKIQSYSSTIHMRMIKQAKLASQETQQNGSGARQPRTLLVLILSRHHGVGVRGHAARHLVLPRGHLGPLFLILLLVPAVMRQELKRRVVVS